MGAYVDYIGWASVTPPATTPSNLRWWNRALVFAEERNLYSTAALGWMGTVLSDIRNEGDMPTYPMRFSQRQVNSKVSVSINGGYLGTFTWKAPTPARECAVGETKCVGEDLYWCRDGIWTLQQYGAPQCIPTPPPPAPPACITEGKWAGLKGICCEGLEKDFWGFCKKIIPTPPEPAPPPPAPPPPAPPPPAPPPEACPRGAMYTRGLFEACDPGYIAQRGVDQQWWEVPNLCVCTEGIEPPVKPAPLEISALIPLVLIIGAVLLVLTMVKRK